MLFYSTFVIRTALRSNRNILCKRFCHSSSQLTDTERPVRVRFAPSPTGYLHLGGLRTALYNYLYAKANCGKFIVRIEDTDQTRLVPDAVESLFKDLEWAGIIPDESVFHGGDYGPYVQSERLDIYRREVKKLLEDGSAYYCFCTERRLELLRKDALRANETPKYDNRCRHLTPVQVAEKIANNDSMCIRFKLESNVTSFDDIVYGKTEYDVAKNEGDPIIIKSDGFPTYHFANVVDDHFMDITHVLRGAEWKISTMKHLLMYNAFGWTAPQYAHLPLILNSDGSKLSKRHDNASLEYYRSKGILPQALINYITFGGGGFALDRENNSKSYSMQELAEMFDLRRITDHPNRLSPELLDDCNRLELAVQIRDPASCQLLVKQVQELVRKTFPKEVGGLDLEENHVREVLQHWACDRLTSVQQLVENDSQFFWILPDLKDLKIDADASFDLDKLIEVLNRTEFNEDQLHSSLRKFCKEHKLKTSKFMMTMRALLSDTKDGPRIGEMMSFLGRKKTIERLQRLKSKTKSK